MRELAKGPRSRWAAYLDCLPRTVHNIDTVEPHEWHDTPWVGTCTTCWLIWSTPGWLHAWWPVDTPVVPCQPMQSQHKTVETQQALTMQVWQGAAAGIPPPRRLLPNIDLPTYRWAVAMVRRVRFCAGARLMSELYCNYTRVCNAAATNRSPRGRWVCQAVASCLCPCWTWPTTRPAAPTLWIEMRKRCCCASVLT